MARGRHPRSTARRGEGLDGTEAERPGSPPAILGTVPGFVSGELFKVGVASAHPPYNSPLPSLATLGVLGSPKQEI